MTKKKLAEGRPPCRRFGSSVSRPGGLIAAPLDPPLASLCSCEKKGSLPWKNHDIALDRPPFLIEEGAATKQPRAERSAALGLVDLQPPSPERAKQRATVTPFQG